MFAIEFDNWVDRMRGTFGPSYAPDAGSVEKLKCLFVLTDTIAPTGDDERKEFWIRIPCGTYEEIISMYPGEAQEYKKEYFLEEYPDAEKWYSVLMLRVRDASGDEDLLAVFIDNNYVLSVGDINMKGRCPIDAGEFIDALTEAAERTIGAVKAGIYNDTVKEQLPYGKRYGRISRKAYWDIHPEFRKEYRSAFTREDRIEFSEMNVSDRRICSEPEHPLDRITARMFFEACMIGYQAAGIDMRKVPGKSRLYSRDPEEEIRRYNGFTPREWYMSIADGRDNGLTSVPLDDAEAFAEWLEKKGPYYEFNGSHPWEVVPSVSVTTSLHFFIISKYKKSEDDDGGMTCGYYFAVSGKTFWRSPQTIAFFLAVRRAGWPVILNDAAVLQARLLETDDIGITPYGRLYGGPVSRIGYDVYDLISLIEEDKKEEVIKAATWLPEKEVKVKSEN